MNRSVVVAVTLVSLGLAACGGKDSSVTPDPAPAAPPDAPDSGAPSSPVTDGGTTSDHDVADAALGDASADAPHDSAPVVCNSLQDLAPSVAIDAVDSAPPAPEGGVIADGTYLNTAATLFTGPAGAAGPTGKTTKITLRFSGMIAESVVDGIARTAAFSVAGTLITTAGSCPSTRVQAMGYAATPTSFVAFIPDAKGTLMTTFTRQ